MLTSEIPDLNVRTETSEREGGSASQDPGSGKDFLHHTLLVQEIKLTVNKWDFITLKGFCTKRKTSINWRNHLQNSRKIFARFTCDRITYDIQGTQKLNTKGSSNPTESGPCNWVETLRRGNASSEELCFAVFTVFSHQGGANWSYFPILLARVWTMRDQCAPLVGTQSGVATRSMTIIWPSYTFPRHTPNDLICYPCA